jgi:hypothetical protein
MTVKANFAEVYRKAEAVYGREPSDLDIDRAFLRYLKIVDLKETKE